MSWWIYLQVDGQTIDTDTIRQEGGTQVVGGISEAELNVTYNYAKHFDFGTLDGLSANKAAILLQKAIDNLGDDRSDNYWEPTEGNVKQACQTLLEFCQYAMNHNLPAIMQVH